MKKFFTAICIIEFVILLGTAGTSDLEMEAGIQVLTMYQLYSRLGIGMLMFFGGGMCSGLCSNKVKKHTLKMIK